MKIRTFSIIIAKPGLMADTLLILEFPSFRSLWLFPMSIHAFSPNCRSRSWAFYDSVRPVSPRLLMYTPIASCMTCPMDGMCFLNAGHSIRETSSVDCSSRAIETFEEALSVIIPRKQPSVSSQRSTMSYLCTASLAFVCWPLTYSE
jgi:hypothetical protein